MAEACDPKKAYAMKGGPVTIETCGSKGICDSEKISLMWDHLSDSYSILGDLINIVNEGGCSEVSVCALLSHVRNTIVDIGAIVGMNLRGGDDAGKDA